MIEQHSESPPEIHTGPGTATRGINKQTAFREPLWLDALKTLGVAGIVLLITIALGSILALLMIAPWGRASPECSMWCVLDQELASWFSD